MSGHRTIVNATATAGRCKGSTTPWNPWVLPQVADVLCVATTVFGVSRQHREEKQDRDKRGMVRCVQVKEKKKRTIAFVAARFPGTRGPESCSWSGVIGARDTSPGAEAPSPLSNYRDPRYPPTSYWTDSEQTHRFRILYVSHPTYCHTVIQLSTNFQQCLEGI